MTEEKPLLCDYRNRDNEPCYGKLDEFYDGKKWITFCEGHQTVPFNGGYVPKDPIRRWIFSQQNQKIRLLEAENKTLWEMVNIADKKLLQLEGNEIEIPDERLEILY